MDQYRELIDIVRMYCADLPDMETLNPTIPLADQGLSSLDLEHLLVRLEEHFDVMVPDEDLSLSIFDTVSSLWTVFEPLLRVGPS